MLCEDSRRRWCSGDVEVKAEVLGKVEDSGGRDERKLEEGGRAHIDVYGNSFITLLISTRYFDSATDHGKFAPAPLINA